MADSPSNPNAGGEGPLYAPETGFSLFLKLFIIPALIVLVALGIFFLGTLAVQHPKSAQQYLEELKSDSTSRRWQAAYELSRMLNQGEKIEFDQNLRAELVKTFAESGKDDPRVREYLALVLGRLKESSAVTALAEATKDGSNDVRIYSLWALGNIEDEAGGPAALAALSDPDMGVQRMAVGALSALRYAPAKSALAANLKSMNAGLRFDSAVALARLKDDRSVPVLMEMLTLKADEKLKDAGEKADDQSLVQSAKLAAIEAVKEMPSAALKAQIAELAKKDPDVKVQEAALSALKK
jgi:HEAT repeat protein